MLPDEGGAAAQDARQVHSGGVRSNPARPIVIGCSELAGPLHDPRGIILADEGIKTSRRPTSVWEVSVRIARKIHAGVADGNPCDLVVVPSAKLARPEFAPRGVVFPDEGFVATRVALARQGPTRVAGNVDARGVEAYRRRPVVACAPKLAGPLCIPLSVILADERVVPRSASARQKTLSITRNVDARRIDSNSVSLLVVLGPELACPEDT